MSITAVVNLSMTEIQTHLQSIAELGVGAESRVVRVYNTEDLMDQMEGVPRPCAGVIYEGMRAVADGDTRVSHKMGLSAELVISIVMFMDTERFGLTTDPQDAVLLLDKIRDKIKGTRGPSGNTWRFSLEAAAVEKKGEVVWVQRWILPSMLT